MNQDDINKLRHSTTHIMAQAVQNIWGQDKVKLGVGPVIENGFYYDFDLGYNFSEEDLKTIQKEMQKIINTHQTFVRREVSVDNALKELQNQPYKIELVNKKNIDGKVSFYDNVDKEGNVVWTDLCQGPHIENTKDIKAFKVQRASGAYWLGKETNPQMQRLYGTAFESKQELNDFLLMQEQAAKRDHRKLGKELDLFSFPEEIGSGLSIFHPKGAIVRMEMENYSKEKHIQGGYSFVNTPHITKGKLYEVSGHLDWYKEGMYPAMTLDEEKDASGNITKEGAEYYLKPMNCPMHNLVFDARQRSYRELPLRLFEFGTVYRYEKSGVVHGITRARGFTQDDAHIYCTKSQMKDELNELLKFVLNLLKDYGLDDFYLELSTKDPKKSVGSDEIWDEATRTLEEVANESGLELKLDEEGAAFYGPKISVQARDAIGRYWQMSTIQLDFNLPERFNLNFQNSNGELERPVMIHRALFGSIERFFGVLTEHYGGAFPAWLAPIQVKGIPVADEYFDYVQHILKELQTRGIRVELDSTDDRFNKKIRNAQKEKVPFVLIGGQEDFDGKTISIRLFDGTQKNNLPIKEAVDFITNIVKNRVNKISKEEGK